MVLYNHNIVILTRHKGYYKEERTDATIRIAKLYYHRYPMLVKALSQRAHVYNRTLDLLDRLERERNGLVIPSDGAVREPDGAGSGEAGDFYWQAMRRPSGFTAAARMAGAAGGMCQPQAFAAVRIKRSRKCKDSGCGKRVSVLP